MVAQVFGQADLDFWKANIERVSVDANRLSFLWAYGLT